MVFFISRLTFPVLKVRFYGKENTCEGNIPTEYFGRFTGNEAHIGLLATIGKSGGLLRHKCFWDFYCFFEHAGKMETNFVACLVFVSRIPCSSPFGGNSLQTVLRAVLVVLPLCT